MLKLVGKVWQKNGKFAVSVYLHTEFLQITERKKYFYNEKAWQIPP